MTVILMQTFSRFVIEADFYLNQSFIAKNICINKDVPKSGCGGKCYLKKQLKNQDKQQQSSETRKDKWDVQLFFCTTDKVENTIIPLSKPAYSSFDNLYHSTFLHSVFRPPSA